MTTEYKVEMLSTEEPTKLGTAEAETKHGAIMEVMEEIDYFRLAKIKSCTEEEAKQLYGDGLHVRAVPVKDTKEMFVVRDDENGRWYFDEKPEEN